MGSALTPKERILTHLIIACQQANLDIEFVAFSTIDEVIKGKASDKGPSECFKVALTEPPKTQERLRQEYDGKRIFYYYGEKLYSV